MSWVHMWVTWFTYFADSMTFESHNAYAYHYHCTIIRVRRKSDRSYTIAYYNRYRRITARTIFVIRKKIIHCECDRISAFFFSQANCMNLVRRSRVRYTRDVSALEIFPKRSLLLVQRDAKTRPQAASVGNWSSWKSECNGKRICISHFKAFKRI